MVQIDVGAFAHRRPPAPSGGLLPTLVVRKTFLHTPTPRHPDFEPWLLGPNSGHAAETRPLIFLPVAKVGLHAKPRIPCRWDRQAARLKPYQINTHPTTPQRAHRQHRS